MVKSVANELPKRLRAAFVLPGLGRVQRGAETAFIEIARHLAKFPDVDVEIIGGGHQLPEGLNGRMVSSPPRERFEKWPKFPVFRTEYVYEDAGFIWKLFTRRAFQANRYDVALHCSFPFTNWYLQSVSRRGGPRSIFVTENGDWMCRADSREYRTFRCDGLVCTNPEYYERHKNRYHSVLIPNGVDPTVYKPGPVDPARLEKWSLPTDRKIILMVSAMIESKRVADGVRAAAKVADAFLVIAGDGPERDNVRAVAEREMPGRYRLLGSVDRNDMPDLYRRADAFLHMSQVEPSCISYLEAASSALPSVLHDDTIPRWTLGDTSEYANTSDIDAVAAALRTVLLPATKNDLGARARERIIADWSWDALAAKYHTFLKSCVGSKKTGSKEALCSPL
ncbi:MAG: glycosyltransferase family 4 protein [Gemmataceae bacterium]